MAARIEDAFGLPAAELTPAHSNHAAPASTAAAGSSLRTMSAQDYEREQAIVTAGRAIEVHTALRNDALARYRDTSCLTDQADADRHGLAARAACIRMEALKAQRGQQ